MTAFKPWQVWVADLGESVGYEQGGKRPVVVVASSMRNDFRSETTLVVPVTTRDRRLSHHVFIDSVESGLDKPSWARTEDIQTISRRRMLVQRPLGRLSSREVEEIRMWLTDMLDLDDF